MTPSTRYTIRVALTVALGGFLMGFDASVISGVVGFIEPEFGLDRHFQTCIILLKDHPYHPRGDLFQSLTGRNKSISSREELR